MTSHIKYTQHLKNIISSLPDKPGIYQFLDSNNHLLYVGKAKSLKKRVSSYFAPAEGEKTRVFGKTALLVKKTRDIKYIIVDTEMEALLLENTLIKKCQPRYNIQLKDDKTYPWICIKNERFPRVFTTRNVPRYNRFSPSSRPGKVDDGSLYFGPYASVRMMNTILDLIKQLYKLRTCNYNLSKENVLRKKFSLCLDYQIGICMGPCEGLQTEEEYDQAISEIKEIIKGNIKRVFKHLKGLMKKYAKVLEFEKAHQVKEKIGLLKKYQSKSTVVNPRINNVDVFSIATDQRAGYVNYMKVINGAIVQSHTIELKKKLDESSEELLSVAITELRQRFNSDAMEIITSPPPDHLPKGGGNPARWLSLPIGESRGGVVSITVPQRGDKKKLLELSERNAKYFMLEKKRSAEKVQLKKHTNRILKQMMKDLRLVKPPVHIECFDNSNIHGAYPVAAMVVFKNAKPLKKQYRHYNIKTVRGPNDFASMEEVVYRRYRRLLDENSSLPQLIIVDGGKGQLNSAMKSLDKLNISGKIGIIGIAKKLEEIYFPGDPTPMYLDKKSETLKVIQHLRNEAHRFGISHHRNKRLRETIKSELLEIDGIGKSSSHSLLRKFQSVKKIKKADLIELEEVIGKAKAKIVFEYFTNLLK
ncbi:MAG: excinuclease ABC subunit UvrC [Bacteroidota bacterium]